MKRYDKTTSQWYCSRSADDRNHWLVVEGIEQNDSRDSNSYHMDGSNWDYCVNELQVNDTVGCEEHDGLILIHPWRKDLIKLAEDIERALKNYPLLDDEDFYNREREDIDQQWENWGYSDLVDIITDHLKPFSDSELELEGYEGYELRQLCDSNDELIQTHDSSFYQFREQHVKQIDPALLWAQFKEITIDKESFDALPHKLYHSLFAGACIVKDYETSELLEVPDFIALQYDKKQEVMFK